MLILILPSFPRYCNRECQRNDWKRHKVECGRLRFRRQIAKSDLISAAEIGDLNAVRNLLQQGADINESTSSGSTPIHAAAANSHLAIVRHLVQEGAEKENALDDDTTPLMIAAFSGHTAVVQYLADQGCDVDKARRDYGFTPLAHAACKGH